MEMKCKNHAVYKLLAISAMIISIVTSCADKGVENLKFVDPDIGSVGILLQPTRPAVQVPNQMVRMFPVRKDYIDDHIRFFPLSLISHRNGEIFGLMPFTGKYENRPPVSSWDPQLEVTTPYYYSTWLDDFKTTVEFAPGKKSGYFRITYPEGAEMNLSLRIVQRGKWEMKSPTTLSAEESFSGMKAYIWAETNREGNFTQVEGTNQAKKEGFFTLTNQGSNVLEFRYGLSFISIEQAQKNLSSEIPDWSLEKVKQIAMGEWGKVMGRIETEGGSQARKRTFYTALYRCYERMVDVTEEGKYYSNYDGRVHNGDRKFYVDDWIWDTYLAHHPLRAMLDPDIESDMTDSYIRMYEQSGWLPTFPILWGDNPCMNGFHSTVMILDNWRKGIRNFNLEKAYEAMKKNATQATMLPWRNGPKCRLDDFYSANGFYPALHPGEKETEPLVHGFEKRQAVAVTLGHCYDDWALAQVARELGKTDDFELFMKRSENFRNLYHAERGFFMPKDSLGNWIDIDPLFDGGPGGRDYYDENNGWTYLWQVQHNLPGLIDLMGGKQAFENRLDQLFSESLGRSKYETWAKFPDFSGIVGQYSMGNEPSFHIPYLYNLTDSPWKTQKRIRMLLDTWFPDNLFGIPGDEDGGGMSAFIVFSCMGFYPLVPGLPLYTIGSPVFEKITIHLENGKKFVVSAPGCSETNKYIQKAELNGKDLNIPWFSHDDLMNGGELILEMGPYPDREWGTGHFAFPR